LSLGFDLNRDGFRAVPDGGGHDDGPGADEEDEGEADEGDRVLDELFHGWKVMKMGKNGCA